MLMLGSLMFLSLEILYRGNHRLPIHYIYGLYVFAIVLVGRISIMEGFERSQFFALVLIGAVVFQTGIGPHLVVILLVWWAATKLTWDCTFIDESRDVTGQGLVSAAWDRWRAFQKHFGQIWRGEKSLAQLTESRETSQTPIDERHPASVAQWMKELVWKQKRKNTPGLWAFYFFVVGLGLFAIGQLFVESSDRARNYSLRMFAIYAFSGLGLMMFISLVGLFRYLKQRGTSMPDSIARAWLVVGTLFALAVVGLVLILPWPNTGISLSSLVPQFQTAKRTGDNSPLTEQGKVDGPKGSGKLDDKGAPTQGEKPGQQEGKGGVIGGEKTGSQPTGKPGDTSGGNVGGGQGNKPASSPSPPSQSSGPPQPSNSGKPNSQQQPQKSDDSGAKNADQANGKKPGESKNQGGQGSKDGPKPTPRNQSQSSQQNAPPQSGPPQSNQKTGNKPPSTDQRPPDPPPAERNATANNPPPREAAKTNPPTPPPATTPKPTSILQTILTFLKQFASILIWIVAMIVGFVLFVRYRHEIVDGFGKFVESLIDFFARLFGGKKSAASGVATPLAETVRKTPRKPFSSFRNPFESSEWSRRPAVDVVEYCFEAFEALAADAKIPRKLDETPHEFSRRVAAAHESLQAARQLAELYSQAAYAGRTLSPSEVAPLAAFWARMQEFSRGLAVQVAGVG